MQATRKIIESTVARKRIQRLAESVSFLKPRKLVQFSTTATTLDSSKVYELRTYSLKPEHMKEYLSLTAEKFHLRTAHSIFFGYWTVELGGVNQVVHLWEYDSYEHRAGVRAKLASDNDWISQYFGKILPWFQSQANMTLSTLPNFDKVVYPENKGMYELWLIVEHAENEANFKEKLSNVLKDVNGKQSSSKLCGAFQSEFGNSNSTVVLWQHESFDNTKSLRQEWKTIGSDVMQGVASWETKALIPFKISPMQ